MAKKVVATLKKEKGATVTKVIRAVRNPVTGAYCFKEDIVPNELVQQLIDEAAKSQ
ncbi:MAG: DUF4295 domain-containing protein [Bacteroidia bacterium]|nr:DUF4295 domain-containing protein [Bacteroidia bacterium]MDW8332667.1 DUF4295 domain-containing protein [Bacteroidia bacterium]